MMVMMYVWHDVLHTTAQWHLLKYGMATQLTTCDTVWDKEVCVHQASPILSDGMWTDEMIHYFKQISMRIFFCNFLTRDFSHQILFIDFII